MALLDDTILALIARFVVDDLDQLDVADEIFLKQQIEELQNHIGDASEDQRNVIVLDWIRKHAESYREQWSKKTFSDILIRQRCSDCPLIHLGPEAVCSIHQGWLRILQEYIDGDIDSEDYVKHSLQLLQEHKQELKVSTIEALHRRRPTPAQSR